MSLKVNYPPKPVGRSTTKQMRSKISGYGRKNNAEAIAEAFCDVYCNGSKATKESKAIVDSLNSILKKK